jgi:hypothetical protein
MRGVYDECSTLKIYYTNYWVHFYKSEGFTAPSNNNPKTLQKLTRLTNNSCHNHYEKLIFSFMSPLQVDL